MVPGPHRGEVEARRRAGVFMPDRASGLVKTEIPPVAVEFLKTQSAVFLGFADAEGAPWVTPVTGEPGFITAPDGRSLRIDGERLSTHPLLGNLASGQKVGSLVVDFETRGRVRINGTSNLVSGETLVVSVDEVFSNCPKYIQTRQSPAGPLGEEKEVHNGLDDEFRIALERSDALFLVSGNEELGFDVSHRGGEPGFLQWDGDVLVLPDYQGNRLFQTIGNLMVDPRIGILAVDFAGGGFYHGTGRAHVVWGPAGQREEDREVRITIEEAVVRSWQKAWIAPTVEYSPFLPSPKRRAGRRGGKNVAV